jgi:YhcH/YjgK/YiaL family protein
VQTIYFGAETIYVEPLNRLELIDPYHADHDAAFYRGPQQTRLVLQPGDFTLLYPQDGHQPLCHADGPQEVLKVVAKVRIEATG